MKYDHEKSFREQEDLLRCSVWKSIEGIGYPEEVIFDVYLKDYEESVTMNVHWTKAFKMLCVRGNPHVYTVSAVRWADQSISFAKAVHDHWTGTYEIQINNSPIATQGGFGSRHFNISEEDRYKMMPCMKKDADGIYKLNLGYKENGKRFTFTY